MYHWTPNDVLQMRSTMFFSLLSKGRMLSRRNKFRDFYELTRVATYPHYIKEAQQDVAQYFYENSLSEREIQERDDFRREMEMKAKENLHNYAKTGADALKFFKQTTGATHGR